MTSIAQKNASQAKERANFKKEWDLPKYAICPKCKARRNSKYGEYLYHKINYEGTWTCRYCKKESTLAEWLGKEKID